MYTYKSKKMWLNIVSVSLILGISAAILFSCGEAVDIGEADKVLTSFQIVWPGDFTNACITGVPVSVTIKAIDQNGELFGTWIGTVSIEKDNADVTLNHETVEIDGGTKQIALSFTVAGEETVKIRVRYGEISSSWSALITVQKEFSIATIVPDDGSFLVGHQEVKITFNDSADTGSLSIGGDLGAYTVSWDSVTYTDDTLTLSPDGFWNDDERSLTVGCDAAGGGQSDNGSVTYDVLHGMFVRLSDSDDSYEGTADRPKRTIRGAIDGVTGGGYDTAQIRVQQGEYTVDWQEHETQRIEISEGISLFGGYSSDSWSTWDPEQYQTTVRDTSESGGVISNPTRAIYFKPGVTASTVIDGFTIMGGSGSYSAAIFCEQSAPTIRYNSIDGGSGSSNSYGISNKEASPHIIYNEIKGGGGTGYSYGIYNASSSSPVIEYNDVDGGSSSGISRGIGNSGAASVPVISKNRIDGGSTGSRSDGIFNSASPAKIWNNTINGGNGGNVTYGVYNEFSSPVIRNNTIDGGQAGDYDPVPCCIVNEYATPAVDNNILFFTSHPGWGYGYCEKDDGSDPGSFRNNSIFDCPTALFYNEGTTSLTVIADVNALSEASGNISEDISSSLDSEYRFTGNLSLVGFDTAGLDGSPSGQNWGFTDDKDGVTRTGDTAAGWSIGAYEY